MVFSIVIFCSLFIVIFGAPAENSQTAGTFAADDISKNAPAQSYGTQAADDFSKNLQMMNQNLYTGVTSLSDPLVKLAVDTAPNLAHLYAVFNGVNVPPKLAALAKKIYGNVAVTGGKLVGDTAVLGSSVVGSAMTVGAHGVQAGSNVAEAAAKSGIDLAGKFGDHVVSGTKVGTDILASGLSTAGDVALAGAAGVNVVSQGISGLLDAIGGRLVAAIESAHKTAKQLLERVKVLQDGAVQFENKNQENVYKGLMAYVEILKNIQNLFSLFAKLIAGFKPAASITVTSGAPASNPPPTGTST